MTSTKNQKYKVTNISRYLNIFGLYPGKSKTVSSLNSDLLKLHNRGFITIEKVNNNKINKNEVDNPDGNRC